MGGGTRGRAIQKVGFGRVEILDLLSAELLSVLEIEQHGVYLLLLLQIVAVVRTAWVLESLRHG